MPGRSMKKMKNISIFILLFFCLFQLNMTLFSQDDALNTISANTDQPTEKKTPMIDQNAPNMIKTATFAMG